MSGGREGGGIRECNPCAPYARRIVDAIRELDSDGRPIGMADCSGAVDAVKDMVRVNGVVYRPAARDHRVGQPPRTGEPPHAWRPRCSSAGTGYPGSNLFSVHTGGALAARAYGQAASEYRFEFDDGIEIELLRHGEHILRSNVICRWWRTDPRAPYTRGAVEAVLHPSYEVLRIELWERRFDRPRALRAVRWRLHDQESIQEMFAMSVEEA